MYYEILGHTIEQTFDILRNSNFFWLKGYVPLLYLKFENKWTHITILKTSRYDSASDLKSLI